MVEGEGGGGGGGGVGVLEVALHEGRHSGGANVEVLGKRGER